jgi:hypothetical protein
MLLLIYNINIWNNTFKIILYTVVVYFLKETVFISRRFFDDFNSFTLQRQFGIRIHFVVRIRWLKVFWKN